MVVTKIIDRRYRGVGRIKRASGTTDPRTYRKILRCLSDIEDQGRIDLLRDVRDGVLKPLVLLDHWQRKALDDIPTADTLKPLLESFKAWAEGTRNPWTKLSRMQTYRDLAKLTRKAAPIAELPALIVKSRPVLDRKDQARTFNVMRANVQAFLRDTVGRAHPAYVTVSTTPTLTEHAKQPRAPQTVVAMDALPVDAAVKACAWGMATTGMGPGEYWGKWEREPGSRIYVRGTKRTGRDRYVPDVGMCGKPRISRGVFEDRLKKQTGGAVKPYDFRRTFATWMEASGISMTRVRLYMGHAPRSVTDIYLAHEVLPHLASDAEMLAAYMKRERESAKLKLVREENAQ